MGVLGETARKRLVVFSFNRCTGCRLCELACSLRNEGVFHPDRARVRVEDKGISWIPRVCLQCAQKLCLDVCLKKAITVHRDTGSLSIDSSKCDGCGKCALACQANGIFLRSPTGPAVACNLCDGNPACAVICPTGALAHDSLEMARTGLFDKAAKGFLAALEAPT